MAGEELVQRWVRRLRQVVPGVVAAGVDALLEAHADTYAPLPPRPQAASLGDGSLRAYVAQLLARAASYSDRSRSRAKIRTRSWNR